MAYSMKEIDDYESEIGDLQLQIEDMEQTNSLVFGALVAWLVHDQWSSWIFTTAAAVFGAFVYWKFFAKKPFTDSIESSADDRDSDV